MLTIQTKFLATTSHLENFLFLESVNVILHMFFLAERFFENYVVTSLHSENVSHLTLNQMEIIAQVDMYSKVIYMSESKWKVP